MSHLLEVRKPTLHTFYWVAREDVISKFLDSERRAYTPQYAAKLSS
jgi:hypothetical protein